MAQNTTSSPASAKCCAMGDPGEELPLAQIRFIIKFVPVRRREEEQSLLAIRVIATSLLPPSYLNSLNLSVFIFLECELHKAGVVHNMLHDEFTVTNESVCMTEINSR